MGVTVDVDAIRARCAAADPGQYRSDVVDLLFTIDKLTEKRQRDDAVIEALVRQNARLEGTIATQDAQIEHLATMLAERAA